MIDRFTTGVDDRVVLKFGAGIGADIQIDPDVTGVGRGIVELLTNNQVLLAVFIPVTYLRVGVLSN
ncbi:MAG TPA: hypothetical protein EYP24_00885 [bacterium (Candidatus Stahlbacteria)]|nr:hypothetical protein [Candidatus Stahlbacteria bacterium]